MQLGITSAPVFLRPSPLEDEEISSETYVQIQYISVRFVHLVTREFFQRPVSCYSAATRLQLYADGFTQAL